MIAGALAVALLGCGARTTPAPPSQPRETRARVVVVVVYDQLGAGTLEAQIDHLDPAGALRRTRDRGTWIHRAVYDYAATFTAPGHAAIHSGAPPRESGIGSNRVWSHGPHARISVLDDGEHAILGRTGAFASPRAMRAETVADVVQRVRPESIVVSIAMKDRSAILPGGQHPDLCVWFDARAGGFTTSTWYADALPEWLVAWRERHRLEPTAPWVPMDAASLEARLGPDDRSGEGAYGLGPTFPHDARAVGDADALLAMPESVEHELAMAEEIVARMAIGQDDVTDFLAISIAATDYVGHAFGPDSWEYADALARADRALGAFLSRLEERAGPIAVVLTSDHGVAPLVERARERGHADACRIESEREIDALRAHVVSRLGEGEWIDGWVQPYVYFAPGADRGRMMPIVREWLEARPGIALAIDARAVTDAEAAGESDAAIVARGIPRDPPGDVYLMPDEHSVATEELADECGTSHGSLWSYDREVPVLHAGPGVPHAELRDPTPQRRVAALIAGSLSVPAPAAISR